MKPAAALALATALGVVASCDKPKDRTPAPAEPAQAAVADPTRTDAPLPPTPAWASAYLGQPLEGKFPEQGDCIGNTDNVEKRHVGAASGVTIIGWGWDNALKTPVQRVLLTDMQGQIVGAGETGVERPDVPAAKPEITSPTTGWRAITMRTSGPTNAWGITNDGKGLCKLGYLEF